MVSAFYFKTLLLDFALTRDVSVLGPLFCPLKGCVAPLLVFVLTISNGPFAFKMNVKSALLVFVKVSF